MAQLFIQVDKPYYFAGQTVNGHVYFNIFENMVAQEVMIKFKGWESVRWIEEQSVPQAQAQRINHQMIWGGNAIYVGMDSSDSQNSGGEGEDQLMRYHYVRRGNLIKKIQRYSGGRVIAKFTSILFNFGNNFIPAGQYSFPFSFKTGQNYPASYVDRGSDRTRKGRIKYEIQSFVRGYNQRKRLIKYKTQVIIRQTTVIKNQQKQMVANVKACCCIDKGISKIKCFFDKNAYSPGQTATVHCILDTKQSKVDVTSVDITLVNKITYKSNQNHQKIIEDRIIEYRFPGVKIGEQLQRTHSFAILTNKSPNKTDIKPTARGSKLSSVYYLKVSAQLDTCCTCCSQLPIVYQDILIYPYIPVNYTFNAPQNWAPKTMPMMNLQVMMNANNPNLQRMQNPYQ